MRQCANSILRDSACGCLSARATKTGENPKQILNSKHIVSVLQETKEGLPNSCYHKAQGGHRASK